MLLQLPMFKVSRDFIVLSLDGSRAVQDHLNDEYHATVPSTLDHYCICPMTSPFDMMTLLAFAQQYRMPKKLGAELSRRSKKVVVIPHPYCPPDPAGPKYEQYCRQSLMLHKPFCALADLLAGYDTYSAAYAAFLQPGSVPPLLEDDLYRLQQQAQHQCEDSNTEVSHYYTS